MEQVNFSGFLCFLIACLVTCISAATDINNEFHVDFQRYYFKPQGMHQDVTDLVSNPCLELFSQKISEKALKQLDFLIHTNGFSDQAPTGMHDLDQYVYEDSFGVGSFGRIFKAKNIFDSETTFAIKVVDLLEDPHSSGNKKINKFNGVYAGNMGVVEQNIDSTYHDVLIPATFPHPNIVKIFRVFFRDGFLFIVMEAIPHGRVLENGDLIPCIYDGLIRAVMQQVFTAVKFLHDNNVMHRDLHAGNIMLSYDPESRFTTVKLIDFGQARFIDKEKYPVYSESCAVNHRPPECLHDDDSLKTAQDASFDIWCLGALMYDFATSKFQGFPTGQVPLFDSSIMTAELYNVILACCEENPADRPSIADLQEFSYFQIPVSDFIIFPGMYEIKYGPHRPLKSPVRPCLSSTPIKQKRESLLLSTPKTPRQPSGASTPVMATPKLDTPSTSTLQATPILGAKASSSLTATPILATPPFSPNEAVRPELLTNRYEIDANAKRLAQDKPCPIKRNFSPSRSPVQRARPSFSFTPPSCTSPALSKKSRNVSTSPIVKKFLSFSSRHSPAGKAHSNSFGFYPSSKSSSEEDFLVVPHNQSPSCKKRSRSFIQHERSPSKKFKSGFHPKTPSVSSNDSEAVENAGGSSSAPSSVEKFF